MTFVLESAATFVSDATAGLLGVHGDLLRAVDGGVARATDPERPKVALVTGGGSGHYPAFAGYVGPGLCDAAVVGELFASPSTAQILRVCEELPCERGVLFAYGNYAGDVLNFEAAAARLRETGTPAICLAVTDDVASAGVDERERRRGVAGDVLVLKVLGAAAESGLDLDEVVRLGHAVNDATRTFGVAFTGATMPGQDQPMFSLPPGTMGVGLGIHGEPGISEEPVASAAEIARLLVERVWAERPTTADDRVAVLLNSLGATKHEELFVLWHYVCAELRERGARWVDPLVGEYVTSLDMAGVSLTVTWLDDELAEMWSAPARTAVLQRGTATATGVPVSRGRRRPASVSAEPAVEASEASHALAARLDEGFSVVAATLAEAEDELGRLDAVAGDGDHGQGMARGSAAARAASAQALEQRAGAPDLMRAAADAWADRAGGTSGALWGWGLRAAAGAMDHPDGEATALLAAAVRAAAEAVQTTGGAVPGDKTLVDALVPFADTLANAAGAGDAPATAWRAAAAAASRAAEATSDLTPKLGRARPLAEQSLGHPDPGAVSLAMVVTALAPLVEGESS